MGGSPSGSTRHRWVWVLVAVAIVVIALVAAIAGGLLSSLLGGPGGTAVAACQTADPKVADPSAPHGLFVLNPPTNPHQPYYADSVEYLENDNPTTCGADFWVHWNTVDRGPNATPEYNWSSVDSEIEPWAAAGKVVNLIFQTVGYGPNQSWIPSYVLPQIHTLQCGDSPLTPLFWEPPYPALYESFIRAAVDHFETNPTVGNLRFGLGTGGETFPLYDVSAPGCEAALNATGFTVLNWTSYLLSMLDLERSLDSRVQLMVALNGVFPGIPDNVSKMVSARAAADGIGFGSEGLEESNVAYNGTGGATCRGGYCQLFSEYAGEVPLELQTYSASQPNGSGPTGSLVTLLPWAVAVHTQVLEIYFVDWLTAFDPNYPAYGMYHVPYAGAFTAAAKTLEVTSPLTY